MANSKEISRRDFLKLGALALSSFAFTRLPDPIRNPRGLQRESENAEANGLELLPEKTIEVEGRFTPNCPITAIDIPLRTDLTFDPKNPVSVYELPSQSNLTFHNLFFCRDSSQPTDRQIQRLTVIPNTMGTNNLLLTRLDQGSFNSYGSYRPLGTEHPGLSRSSENILGEASYIVGDGIVYPNKILNLLNSMAYILENQERSGALKKGSTYSYIDLINLTTGRNYVPGYTSTREVVGGGGVCAGATVVANAFWVAAKNMGIPFEDTYADPKYNHPSRYKLGPFAPDTFFTDTTVQVNGSIPNYDYLITPPRDLYINVHAAIIPNGIPFSETNAQGLYVVNDNGTFLKSDAQFVLNVSLTTEPPKIKAADLRSIRQKYIDFRTSNHQGSTSYISSGCRFLGNFNLDDTPENKVVRQIYPEQDIHLFSNEIARSQYLQDVFALQQILNAVDVSDAKNIAGVVRNSGWYKEKVSQGEVDQDMENAITQLNAVAIDGQPVQCIGWATLIAGLPYPNMPLSIGSVDILGPNDLIPNSILTYPNLQTAPSPTGGVLIANRDMKISEINPNDCFIMKNSAVGHVGVILSRKLDNGKSFLLVTESNRHGDGRIQIYTVDENNFNAKLGMPPAKKIMLRRSNTSGN